MKDNIRKSLLVCNVVCAHHGSVIRKRHEILSKVCMNNLWRVYIDRMTSTSTKCMQYKQRLVHFGKVTLSNDKKPQARSTCI